MEKFYKHRVAPFVRSEENDWHLKKRFGLTVPFSETMLHQQQRANIIRLMFFSKHGPNVRFSLTPLNFSANVQSVRFSINGETFTDTKNSHGSHEVAWPGAFKETESSLVWSDDAGHTVTRKSPGFGAGFRMLERAQLRDLHDGKFEITLRDNQKMLRYELQSKKLISPFIPKIVEGFRCPEKVFMK